MEKNIAHKVGGILIILTILVTFIIYERNKPLKKAYQQIVRQPVPTPAYPIVKWVKIHRGVWSEPVVVSKMERMDWACYDDVPILVSDNGRVHNQDAGSHLDMEGIRDHRATSFMIDPRANPSAIEADMKCTINER